MKDLYSRKAGYVSALPEAHRPKARNLKKQARTSAPDQGLAHFEKNLRELESLVEKLEKGELSLEESLKQFEHGMKLTQACQEALQSAEQRVEILTEKEGTETIEEFSHDETAASKDADA